MVTVTPGSMMPLPHSRRTTALPPLAALFLITATACVAPTTQLGTISRADLQAEQLKQQQLVIRSDLRDQQRVEDVGYTLLKAALPLCGANTAMPRAGLRFANVYSFTKEYQPAAAVMGFTDTLVVTGVARGSAAELSGIRAGDRLLGVGATELMPGKDAAKHASDAFRRIHDIDPHPSLSVRHGALNLESSGRPDAQPASIGSALPISLAMPADTVCGYAFNAVKSDVLNAWADGQAVYVTSAMLRFAGDDDELSVVLAHEISHNAMKHIEAQSKNAGIGAFFGAILDVAAATQGVNTGGQYTKAMSDAAAKSFSQDFEREADYVGMYLLARAGRPFASAADFWRRMGQENPGSIKFATSHPTTAERYVRLERAAVEIQAKQAAGEPLLPELKKK